jgi:glycosyltransferase involved in cell wall biosynthesis
MISIVSIIYKNLTEIEKTCVSVDRQDARLLEHIIVAAGFSTEDKILLSNNWKSSNRIFIFDQDKSLYNAMNIGLIAAKGDSILFLNGGDTLKDHNSVSMIFNKQKFSCMAFSTLQRYGNSVYLRPPCKYRKRELVSCSHQGFVAPLDRDPSLRIRYNENSYISADQEWIRENVKRYGVDLHDEVLSEFQLGGLSNRPSLKALQLHLKSSDYLSVIKLFPKIILYFLLRPERYYRWLARFNRYKFLAG